MMFVAWPRGSPTARPARTASSGRLPRDAGSRPARRPAPSGSKRTPLHLGRPDDRLARALGRQRPQDVDRPRQLVADPRHLRPRASGSRRAPWPSPAGPAARRPRRASSGPTTPTSCGALRVTSSSNWSITSKPPARLADLLAQRPDQLARALGDQRRAFVSSDMSKSDSQRRDQRLQRVAARGHRRRGPLARVVEVALLDHRHHAGLAQRRLADARVAGDDHQRVGAEALDDRADLDRRGRRTPRGAVDSNACRPRYGLPSDHLGDSRPLGCSSSSAAQQVVGRGRSGRTGRGAGSGR